MRWASAVPRCRGAGRRREDAILPRPFILDHDDGPDDGPDDDEEAGKKRKRKPYRLRWPDEVRDEVLARLIELNRARAEDERKRGVAVTRRAREADADEVADADG